MQEVTQQWDLTSTKRHNPSHMYGWFTIQRLVGRQMLSLSPLKYKEIAKSVGEAEQDPLSIQLDLRTIVTSGMSSKDWDSLQTFKFLVAAQHPRIPQSLARSEKFIILSIFTLKFCLYIPLTSGQACFWTLQYIRPNIYQQHYLQLILPCQFL